MSHFQLPFSDPVLVFGSVMLLILLAPFLARKAGLPDIVGLIFAGILVGPHGLGLLARGESIQLLGKVGLLYIMFQAGLEIDLHQVRKNKAHTLLFGLVTFFIPLALGTALGFFIFGMSIPVAILLASMFSSHTLLTFPAAAKLGLTRSRAVTTTIGGTIITDTLALIVLAVVVASAGGDLSLFFWLRLFALMIIYMVLTLLLIPRLGRFFFKRMGSDEELEFVFVIALTFTASYLAHLAGLEPIIGAFLAGLSLNSLIPEKSVLMSRIHFTGNAIFIPFFLVSVGMLVNFRLLFSSGEVWVVIIGMALIALVSKLFAALVSAKILGYRRSESALIYGLSVNQAAATLAAVLVGYSIGLFDSAVITGTIMMIAITCLVGSLVTQRAGKQVALQEKQGAYNESASPHRIMLPMDQRKGSRELIDLAMLLRSGGSEEPVYPVTVTRDDFNIEKKLAEAENILAHSVVRAMSVHIPVTPLTLVDINEASGIIRAARENRISLITLLWDGERKAGSRTFGHTLDEVIDRSSQMVFITRLLHPVSTTKRVLLLIPPYGHRQIGFEKSCALAKTLASRIGASISLLADPTVLGEAKEFLQSLQPRVEMEFRPTSGWKQPLQGLNSPPREGDWVILFSARKGDISWQPALDRLPGQIVVSCSNSNVSVLYPAACGWDSCQAAETITVKHQLISGFVPERSVFNMDASTVEEALQKLLGRYFGARSSSTKTVTSVLHRISQEEPVELTRDVILLHTHLPMVEESVIFLGVNRKPLKVPLATESPHVLVILLDPVDQDPALHLKALADIARLIRIPGVVEEMRQVKSFSQFIRMIEEKLEEG